MMRGERVLGVIPARLGSERLPRKPLVELAGRPLIEWVWRRVATLGELDACVIATDSAEIARVCAGFGARVAMTRVEHRTGTERVAEVAELPEYRTHDIVVNVQGDEPFVCEEQIAAAIGQVRHGYEIGTVAAPVGTAAALRDPAVVKVVRRADGAALYFSRSAIPYRRDGDPDAGLLGGPSYLRHIGVYACRRAALLRWVALPESRLEALERLEQLRALEAGMTIGVAVTGAIEAGVDTPADAERAAARLRARRDDSTRTGQER
jgi:3-deoxy-manno-octulosonate cytidylyltransferase (CMP-KDO synthetase)